MNDAVRQLADRFLSAFPERLSGARTVGREAEYPVVRDDGSAADVRALWAPLMGDDGPTLTPQYEGEMIVGLDGPDYSYALEVGWGTVEVITGPCQDLYGLKAVHEAAVQRLYRATEALDYRILGYGAQPLTPPGAALMSPKARYKVMHEALGDPWYWFSITASDQLHVSIDRAELVSQINLINLLTPVAIALCANSPIYAGGPSGFMSSREAKMGEILSGQARHGMLASPVSDMEDFVGRLCDQPFLIHREGGGWRTVGGPFRSWLDTHGPDWDSYLMHEHYIWNSGRPRTRHATIEMRSPCQQPHASHMSAAALGLAMVEAAPQIAAFLQERLGGDTWPLLRAWHKAVIVDALAAPEPFPGLLAGVLERGRDALARRGLNEQSLLSPLEARLEARRSPAQEALSTFEEGGIALLVERAALR